MVNLRNKIVGLKEKVKIWIGSSKFIVWMNYGVNPTDDFAYLDIPDLYGHLLEFKKNAPIRYFFSVVLVDLKDVIFCRIFPSMIDWVAYRTFKRYHIVDTKLKPKYYDTDEVMLHACFSLLVDYVERECANMYEVCNKKSIEKRRFKNGKLFRNKNSDAKLGLAYLEDDDHLKTNPADIESLHSRKVIKELYTWWTETRPKREYPPEPEIRGDDGKKVQLGLNIFRDSPDELSVSTKNAYTEYVNWLFDVGRLDDQWRTEDDEMLEKLVVIRSHLWT